MAKFYGEIGYAKTIQTEPGVWEETIVKRNYYGELIRNSRSLVNSGNINDNVNISNEISILADPYANENFHSMRYVEFMGAKWKINSVEVKYPRLILNVGGLYTDVE